MYMNTLKLSQIRCCNKKLALRLKTESLSEMERECNERKEEKFEKVEQEQIGMPLPCPQEDLVEIVEELLYQ